MTLPSNGKLLYHLTHIKNIKGILQNGLMPRNQLNDSSFFNTANLDIIRGRENLSMNLGDFVPFHFFVKNPYDGAVCAEFGSENMVIISIMRPKAGHENGYFIVPRHPLNGNPEILPYAEGFQKIKWDILDDIPNRDYSDSAIKQACLAECDISRTIPKEDFAFIYVKTEEGRKKVLALLNDKQTREKVKVNPNMFRR